MGYLLKVLIFYLADYLNSKTSCTQFSTQFDYQTMKLYHHYHLKTDKNLILIFVQVSIGRTIIVEYLEYPIISLIIIIVVMFVINSLFINFIG